MDDEEEVEGEDDDESGAEDEVNMSPFLFIVVFIYIYLQGNKYLYGNIHVWNIFGVCYWSFKCILSIRRRTSGRKVKWMMTMMTMMTTKMVCLMLFDNTLIASDVLAKRLGH